MEQVKNDDALVDFSLEFHWQPVLYYDITLGLKNIHENDTVHTDLKPKNGNRFEE